MPSLQSLTLRDLDHLFRNLPGARSEARSLLDVVERELTAFRDAHRARSPVAAELVRLARWRLGRPNETDAEIFDAELTVDDSRQCLARFHRFASWDDLVVHAELRVDPDFEAAADAIVSGDEKALAVLLAQDPSLAHARSPFGHRATLLHHVAANAVEESRQWQSPSNAVAIAQMLLRAGSEPDATCHCYGREDTTLYLLVSSVHPALAGVQAALVDALIDGGARVDGPPGTKVPPIETAVQFGYLPAAEALARRGAQITNVVVAAGLGRIDEVERLLSDGGERLDEAFRAACLYGRTDVAEFLLGRGASATKQDHEGFTGLHWAAFRGRTETVRRLVARDPSPLEIKNVYGGTVLDCVVWAAKNAQLGVDHLPVVVTLLAAGARPEAVTPFPSGDVAIDALIDAALKAARA